ncbi:hypothetical protein PQ455_10190 [Sphingomonas naphthae]|uniref:Transmembrane protein n=1 Tax=Sphingomonas naphthae TaxID=1813468 RepID=A0ABY7TFM8_9SPHN|nr:hypothetical protein [Sphingomonas naphthae]WCT72018.1 hypothetical protein PQ455_10190 [Sphingomonas naphthae]
MTQRRYMIELMAALGLYAVLLVGMNWADRAYHPVGGARIALALLPMLGCVAALIAIMRGIGRLDELQRRMQFEALAFGFAVTALGTFAYGFLEDAGLPRMHAFAVWPVMAVAWMAGLVLARLRYR